MISFFSCKKDKPPVEVDKTIGINYETYDDQQLIKIKAGDTIIDFDVNDAGEIEVEDAASIEMISCEGKFSINLTRLFAVAPKLNTLITDDQTMTYGDISAFPSTMVVFNVQGGLVTGSPSFSDELKVFRMNLGHSVTFDISDLPDACENVCMNSGTVTGVIDETFPTSMRRFVINGDNTISGDYGLIKGEFPVTFSIKGKNKISTYTNNSADFTSSLMNQFLHTGTEGHGLNSAQIDELLIDLSEAEWIGNKKIELTGSHEARTRRSDQAVLRLERKGVTVQTN